MPSLEERWTDTFHSITEGIVRGVCVSVLFLGASLLVTGCGSVESSDDQGQWQIQPGAIIHYGDTSTVDLSTDTVQVGQPLHVSATTFGGGCTRAAGNRTETDNRNAVLTPLDSVYRPGPNEFCTLELKTLDHSAEIVFENPGTAHVVVRGRNDGPDVENPEEVHLRRSVTVVE